MKCAAGGECCVHDGPAPGWSCCTCGLRLFPGAPLRLATGAGPFRLVAVGGQPGHDRARSLKVEYDGGDGWIPQSRMEFAACACGAREGEEHAQRCPRRFADVFERALATPPPACRCPSLFVRGHEAGCPERKPPRHVFGPVTP